MWTPCCLHTVFWNVFLVMLGLFNGSRRCMEWAQGTGRMFPSALQISPDHIATDAVRCPMRAADVAIGCEFPCHRPRDDPSRESSPLIGHAPNIDQLKGIKGPTKTDQERSRQSLNLACLLGLLYSLFLCFLCGLFLLRHPPCSWKPQVNKCRLAEVKAWHMGIW